MTNNTGINSVSHTHNCKPTFATLYIWSVAVWLPIQNSYFLSWLHYTSQPPLPLVVAMCLNSNNRVWMEMMCTSSRPGSYKPSFHGILIYSSLTLMHRDLLKATCWRQYSHKRERPTCLIMVWRRVTGHQEHPFWALCEWRINFHCFWAVVHFRFVCNSS